MTRPCVIQGRKKEGKKCTVSLGGWGKKVTSLVREGFRVPQKRRDQACIVQKQKGCPCAPSDQETRHYLQGEEGVVIRIPHRCEKEWEKKGVLSCLWGEPNEKLVRGKSLYLRQEREIEG